MKKTTILMAMLAVSMAAGAQNDTVKVIRPDSVSIERNGANVNINVYGNETSRDYRYSMSFDVNNAEPVVTKEKNSRQTKELDFGVPVFETKSGPSGSWVELTLSPAILWGCTGASSSSEADIDAFSSINIWLPGIAGLNYHASKKFSLGLDYGLEWRNYRMTDNKQFVLGDDKVMSVTNIPQDCKSDFSRIKIISQTLSLTARYHFCKDGYLRIGPVFAFNQGLSVKTKYKNAEGNKEISKTNDPKANLFRLEWLADVQYNVFGFFVRYSPNDVLKSGYGPKFSTTTVGVSIGW